MLKKFINFIKYKLGLGLRNDSEDQALLELGEKIKNSSFNLQPASSDFQARLKAKILEKRREKIHMKLSEKIAVFVQQNFKPKRLISAVALVVLVAVVVTTLQFTNNRFAPLVIDAAFAHDNFEVEASNSDSIGIENNSYFIIKSKQAINNTAELKQNISLIPNTDFELKKINDHEFKLTPNNFLANRRVYRLEINSVYAAENNVISNYKYSWAFQVKDTFKIINTLPADKSNGVPINSGIEIAFSHENITDFEKNFSISPEVKGRFEYHYRTAVFVPTQPLDYGTVFTVKVGVGVGLKGTDKKLSEEKIFQFETQPKPEIVESKEQRVYFFNDQLQFGTNDQPIFTAYQYGSEGKSVDLNVAVYNFKSQNDFIEMMKKRDFIPNWQTYTRNSVKYDVSKLNLVSNFDDQLKFENNTYYLQYPSVLPAGYYLVQLKTKDKTSYVFVQISDLAGFVSVNKDKTLVWVNSLATKKPQANVNISEEKNKLNEFTKKDGVAVFPTFDFDGKDDESFYFKLNHGNSSTVLPLYTYYQTKEYSFSDKFWTYFYTDRSLYQPNDNVNFWGFVKGRDTNNEMPKTAKLKLYRDGFYDYYSDQVIISEQEVTVDERGFFNGKIKIDNLNPDQYSLSLEFDGETVQRKYFTVATFNKPLYKISITHDKDALFAGDTLVFDVKTSFFDGTPVSNIYLEYNISAMGIYGARAKTDEKGQVKLKFDTTNSKVENFDINVTPVNAEAGEISAYDSVFVSLSHAKFYSPSTTVSQLTNNNARIKTIVKEVDLSKKDQNYLGKNLGNIPVTARITEVTHVAKETGVYYDFINKVSRKTYSYERVERKLPDLIMLTHSNGYAEADFAIEPTKSYQIDLNLEDGRGGKDKEYLSLYAAQNVVEDDGSNQYVNYYLYSKESDNVYKVGENVSLEFRKNDEAISDSNFLFYQNRLGLADYKVQESPTYNFKFSAENIPNVYISGVYFDGRSYHLTGTSNIIYDKKDSELKIELSADKQKYKPGEKATLKIKVKDKNGKPVSADVNVDLVDAALIDMGGKEIVDPLGSIYSLVDSGEIITAKTHDLPYMSGNGGAEHGGCFLAGTKILMRDRTQKNIEDIVTGDKILTFRSESDHTLVEAEVGEIFRHIVKGYIVINDQLYVTPEHRIFVNNSWMPIGDAKVGDVMIGANGNRIKIFSIDKKDSTVVVYNFKVNKYHTFIANGIYVHNDKDGVREFFPDVALFQSTKTDSNGNAELTFNLPDNITSWRVSAQGITQNIEAGTGEMDMAVSLPLFVDQSLPKELLTADKAKGRLRAYGDSLSEKDDLKFSTKIDGMNYNVSQQGKAFLSNYFSLPQFKEGIYKVISSADSGKNKDAVAHQIKVVDSRLTTAVQKFYEVKDDLKIEGSKDNFTTLTFTDNNQGKFFYSLARLSWEDGVRVDQRLTTYMARNLINQYFEAEYPTSTFDGKNYQGDKGGIKLLTYSEEDLELSAKMAAIDTDAFDNNSLINYFYQYLNQKDINQDEAARALYGLSALGEPVLIPVQNIAKSNNLTVLNKLYIALAAQELGDLNLARNLYNEVVKNNGEQMAPYARINITKNDDLTTSATVLAAILGASLDDKNGEAFWKYAKERGTKDILINFEELVYIKANLPNLKAGPVSFSLDFDGQHYDKKLERGESFSMTLTPPQLASLKFSKIVGNVSVVSNYYKKSLDTKNTTKNISINKVFLVNGKPTNVFKQGDIIEVNIAAQFAKEALNGQYQIIDLLPSGMSLLTNPYSKGIQNDWSILYPIEVNGQKNKFIVYSYAPYWNGSSFKYYARAVTPGEFKAEPTLLQSTNSASEKAFTGESVVTIIE